VYHLPGICLPGILSAAPAASGRGDLTMKHEIGSIVSVNDAGHAWDKRPVIVIANCDGFATVELPEEQSLPSDKRMICYLHHSLLTPLSDDRQQQIASTMGLRLEALPY
jgi:hypothetical protein